MKGRKKSLVGYLSQDCIDDFRHSKIFCSGNTYYYQSSDISLYQYPKHCFERQGEPIKVKVTIEEL